jgi:hypothetical protein
LPPRTTIRTVDGPQQNADPLPLKVPGATANVTHNELFYNRMNWSVASSKTVGKGSDGCCRRRALTDEAIVEEERELELSVPAASGFSAICWFAARDYSDSLGGTVPVGAIDQRYGPGLAQLHRSPHS